MSRIFAFHVLDALNLLPPDFDQIPDQSFPQIDNRIPFETAARLSRFFDIPRQKIESALRILAEDGLVARTVTPDRKYRPLCANVTDEKIKMTFGEQTGASHIVFSRSFGNCANVATENKDYPRDGRTWPWHLHVLRTSGDPTYSDQGRLFFPHIVHRVRKVLMPYHVLWMSKGLRASLLDAFQSALNSPVVWREEEDLPDADQLLNWEAIQDLRQLARRGRHARFMTGWELHNPWYSDWLAE